MKYKLISISDHLIFEDQCIQFLEDLSLKGWKLKKVGIFFFLFEKCNQPFKYQIDSILPSDEYIEITKEMGYHYIGNYKAFHFFINEDLDAIDLQTDETTHKISLLKIYSLGHIALSLALSFFICNFALFIFQSSYIRLDLASFYINFNLYVFMAILMLYGLAMLLNAVHIFILRLYIQERIYDKALKITKVMTLLLKIILCISIIALIYLLIFNQKNVGLDFIVFFLGYLLFIYFIDKYSFRQKSIEKRRIIQCIVTGIWISISIIISQNIPENIIKNENVFYSYTNESSQINQNIFLNEIHSADDNYFEDYYSCLNSSIAKSILQKCVLDTEHQTRLPSEEEIDRMIYEGNDYNMYDIPYSSYEEAIQIFTVYNDKRVDECYYTADTLIIRKDNLVVNCYLEDKTKINLIIEHYFIEINKE